MNEEDVVHRAGPESRHPNRAARWAVSIAVALAGVLAACASGPAEPGAAGGETRVVEADNGAVTIPVRPQRVVATGYAVSTLLEAGAPLVGIAEHARALPFLDPAQRRTYDSLPRVAGDTSADVSYEAMVALEPDLIVLGVPKPVLAEFDLARLGEIAPVVAIGPTVPADWRDFSRRQADAAGVLGGFDAARAAYDARAAELRSKYQGVLSNVQFGHVGNYGQATQGRFTREFPGSFGTNIAQDVGVRYYGQVRRPGPGARASSEQVSLEEIATSLGQATAITYSVNPDGSVPGSVGQVLDSPLWATLPAVRAGRALPVRLTEASTYGGARQTLDAVDRALAPLLTPG